MNKSEINITMQSNMKMKHKKMKNMQIFQARPMEESSSIYHAKKIKQKTKYLN